MADLLDGAGAAVGGIVGAVAGWIGGRRGRSASASVDEARAARIVSEVLERVTAQLEDEIARLRVTRTEEQRQCEARLADLRAEIDQLRARVASLEAAPTNT